MTLLSGCSGEEANEASSKGELLERISKRVSPSKDSPVREAFCSEGTPDQSG